MRDYLPELYGTREWFESLSWQHRWIGYMVGWWAGEFGVPKTVSDFGCGDGWWPKCFHDMGSNVGGIELHEVAKEFIPDSVQVLIHDLRVPVELGRKFDLSICLEVAEHLSKIDGDTLCQTLANHMKDTLLFSAAGPGQMGTGHITLEPHSYWIERIERLGKIKFSSFKTEKVKVAFENITNEAFEFLPKNVMVFCRV